MSADPKPTSDWALLRRSGPFLKPEWRLYTVALLFAPVSALLVVAQPWLLKVAIDDHILRADIIGTQRLALWYLGAIVAGWAAESAYTLALSYGAMRSITALREAIYRHTLSLSSRFFDHRPAGQLLTRATSDVEALGETLTAGAITIVLDLARCVAILVAMLLLDWRLTLVMVVLGPVIGFVVDRLRRILRRLYQEIRTSLADLNAFTAERLGGLEIIQLYSDEARAVGQFDKRLYRYRDAAIQTNVWDALLYAVMDGLSAVTVALMLWYAASGWTGGIITAGLLAAFVDYVAKLYEPIKEMSAKIAILQRASSALEKIFGLLDCRDSISPGSQTLGSTLGAIRLSELRFAYGDGPDVLNGLSLELNAGEVVALVGRTGSGKTTIGRLLTRAYDGYRGSITIDGIELREIAPGDIRQLIGAVRQDVQLFPGNVRFNLTLGRQISDDALWESIHMARADVVVEKLGGLDGQIAHRGANLSVGEAQLLSFARTMAQDPPVVILDEATANVDSITEGLIQEATREILDRKTVLVIAHRLSTITTSDRIAVLDQGLLLELGTHSELLDQGGRYATLFEQQFRDDPPRVPHSGR